MLNQNSSFRLGGLAVLSLLLLAASGCTKKAADTPAGSAAPAASARKTMNLAVWSHYVTPETLQEFEARSGIHVEVSNYSSNEELLAKLQAGASGYDVVVPSDYMVFAMSQLGLLKELDRKRIPHSAGIDSNLLKKQYDPENKFSLPFDWGTTGIAVNRDLYKGPIKGWKDLFANPALKGRFTLLDDSREVIAAALKSQGFSLNSTEPTELAKAKAVLLKARGNLKAFNSETLQALLAGEMAVAHAYSTDGLQARQKTHGKIEYVIPEEGATLWVDNLAIPAAARNVDEAHAFIDFLLEEKNYLATVQRIMVGPSLLSVKALLPKELQADPALFPSDAVRSKLEMLRDLGKGNEAWERVWAEVKVESGE